MLGRILKGKEYDTLEIQTSAGADTKETPLTSDATLGSDDADNTDAANEELDPTAGTTLSSGENRKTYWYQVFIHLLKGNLGPGCFSLPWAFSALGVPLGIGATLTLLTLTSRHCLTLVKIKNDRHPDPSKATYPDVAELVYGKKFRLLVSACVATLQLSVCTVFFSYMGDNLSSIFRNSTTADLWILSSQRGMILLTLPAATALSMLPNLRVLAKPILVATATLFVAFALVFAAVALNWTHRPDQLPAVNWRRLPIALCAIIYSMEGICLVLPLETSMHKPAQFPRTFVTAMIFVGTAYCTVGGICVLAFGSITDASITAYLIENGDTLGGSKLALAANILASFSVLFTYPLQLFPAIELVAQIRTNRAEAARDDTFVEGATAIVTKDDDNDTQHNTKRAENNRNTLITSSSSSFGDGLEMSTVMEAEKKGDSTAALRTTLIENNDDDNRNSNNNTRNDDLFQQRMPTMEDGSGVKGDSIVLRSCLILLTFAVAITIPQVGDLISLAGALTGSALALIFPPLLELRYIWESSERSRWSYPAVRCYVFIGIGLIFCVVGTISSLIVIVEEFI